MVQQHLGHSLQGYRPRFKNLLQVSIQSSIKLSSVSSQALLIAMDLKEDCLYNMKKAQRLMIFLRKKAMPTLVDGFTEMFGEQSRRTVRLVFSPSPKCTKWILTHQVD